MLLTNLAWKVAVHVLNYHPCNLCLKSAMEMLQMLLEETEKNTLITECQIVMLYFVLAIGSVGWDVGCPRSVHNMWMEEETLQVVERQSAISVRDLAALTGPSDAFVHCML